MTVCIAAVCEENTTDPKIILCTDRKVSSALGSSETMSKVRSIVPNKWSCLTSGTDSHILATLLHLQEQFREHKGTVDETNALSLVRAALNKRKLEMAEECIRGKFGISYTEFMATGKSRLPDDQFRSATTEVELLKNDAELIIVGFPLGFSMLIKTEGTYAAIKEDFAVAGEGGYLAQASMLHRAHNSLESLDRSLYCVYEAKKFAEGAPSVGRSTSVITMSKDGVLRFMNHKGRQFLDATYEKLGPQKMPDVMPIFPKETFNQ